MNIKDIILISRPWSFIMTLISVSLGASLALYLRSVIDPIAYILALTGAIVLHATTNVINDYFDIIYKVDVPGAATTRYRPHPIYLIRDRRDLRKLLIASIAMYIAVLAIISPLIYIGRTYLILYWVLGVFLSYIYTGPPLKLKYRALGELIVFLVWGPLMVSGTFYAITGGFDPLVVVASLPIGILVGSVLMANNIRDIEYDSSTGITTLPIKLGRDLSIKLYSITLLAPYIIVLALNLSMNFIYASILTLLSIPLAIRLIRLMRIKVPDTADPMTAQLTLVFGALYILGIIIHYIAG